MDIQQVKDILQITTNNHDPYLATVIPLFEEKIKSRANTRFVDSNGVEELPIDLQHTLAKWIQWDMTVKAGLKARSMGEVSYTYDNEIPSFVKTDIAPYRKVRFR